MGSRRWNYKLALPVVMIFSPTVERTIPLSLYVIYHVDTLIISHKSDLQLVTIHPEPD
jgi:hypothetical protein